MTTENTNVLTNNNNVTISGEIISNGDFSHEVYGEKFYVYNLEVKRLSEVKDIIPLTVSERLIKSEDLPVGTKVVVKGQYRSYNKHEENKSRLILSVFAREIVIEDVDVNKNDVFLTGFVCKPPIYRKTPLGREIADVLLAVNRPYGKSDYIPCIFWGRNARYAEQFKTGTHIQVYGRIQSRVYNKKFEDSSEERTAYEVSVSKFEELPVEEKRVTNEETESTNEE